MASSREQLHLPAMLPACPDAPFVARVWRVRVCCAADHVILPPCSNVHLTDFHINGSLPQVGMLHPAASLLQHHFADCTHMPCQAACNLSYLKELDLDGEVVTGLDMQTHVHCMQGMLTA